MVGGKALLLVKSIFSKSSFDNFPLVTIIRNFSSMLPQLSRTERMVFATLSPMPGTAINCSNVAKLIETNSNVGNLCNSETEPEVTLPS